jgi:hypothetical protein
VLLCFSAVARFLDNRRGTGVDFRVEMSNTLVIKASRLLLALSVSVWMAGGCLFGCSNGEVLAAEVSLDANESSAAVSGESCNRNGQHDCCTRPNAPKTKVKKQIARHHRQAQSIVGSASATSSSALTELPHGMKDCPLMTSATAVTAKSNGSLPDPVHSAVAVLPAIKTRSEQTEFTPVHSFVPNRGPTHLHCCVFLI